MKNYPKVTIVTPSFNQAKFLERTIVSVLEQNYPNLEFIIIDGGSSDESVSIIQKYENQLSWWVSEPDSGQAHAINKGLQRATGQWLAWQNSDDVYFRNSLHSMAAAVSRDPSLDFVIGDMMLIDEHDRSLRDIRYIKPSYKALLAEGMILTNQSAFWHRRIHRRIGFLREDLHYGFDYEWFLRVTEGAKCLHVPKIWGALRLHEDTKTSRAASSFEHEYEKILHGRKMPVWLKKIYTLRRFGLMLARGEFAYVFRGVARRMQGQKKDEF